MTLSEYMRRNKISDLKFAKRVGKNRATVHRWRHHKLHPSWRSMQKIEEITDGKVKPNDWIWPPPKPKLRYNWEYQAWEAIAGD